MYPAGGLARGVSYQRQAPFTTPDCNNVQPEDTLEGRVRGGSRPGLQRTHPDNGGKVNLLEEVSVARVEGDARTTTVDDFQGDTFASEWDAAFTGFPSLAEDGEYPAAVSADDGEVGAVLEDKSPVNTQLQIAEVFIEPYRGTYAGQAYGLVVGATDASTFTEHFVLTLTGSAYSLTRDGTEVATGSPGALAGWFRVEVRSNNTATVVWAGRTIHTTAADLTMGGDRVGFSLEAAADTIASIRAFRYSYSASDPGTGFRSQLVCCNAGVFSREVYPGVLEAVGGAAQFNAKATERVRAQGHLQKLWVADHGRVAGGEDGVITAGVLTAASVSDWTAEGITDDMRVIITNVTGVTQG